MRSIIQICVMLTIVLSLLAACGGKDNIARPPASVCTQTGNITLYTSASMSTPITSITVTAQYNSLVTPVPVYVGYLSPPVEKVLAGYPADGVYPLNYGIDIVQIGANTDNPLRFNTTFNTSRVKATYHAVLRFVATDLALTGPMGCQDLPVTFTVY